MAKRNRNNIVQKKSLVKDIAAKLEKEQKEAEVKAANETGTVAESKEVKEAEVKAAEVKETEAKEAEATASDGTNANESAGGMMAEEISKALKDSFMEAYKKQTEGELEDEQVDEFDSEESFEDVEESFDE